MHGSVFLDKSGNVIRPALLWNDQRTAAECDEIEKLAGRTSGTHQDGGQPGSHRLHCTEDPVAEKQRTRKLRQNDSGAAAERLRSLSIDRRVRHGSQ